MDPPFSTSSHPACTMCCAVSISPRLMAPLSMPCSFHMYTPSATPMPKTWAELGGVGWGWG
jgi:hypothetical protein